MTTGLGGAQETPAHRRAPPLPFESPIPSTDDIRLANRQVLGLILASLILRLVMAAGLGLGIDESYMVAAGRTLSLGYFDHPPASWWLAWGAAHLMGSEAPIVVRLPFLLLFSLTTWLIYRLTARLHGPRAGVWAALGLCVSPVFGFTAGSWVLPDGPLLCALSGAGLCLVQALDHEGTKSAWRWWLGAGLCAGLALFSKYSAGLTLAGALIGLLTLKQGRRALAGPAPWVAAALALAIFAPVLSWNATHGWASFAFQGGRAAAVKLHPFGPLVVLAGEALFVLPWLWLPMIVEFARSLARGPAGRRDWLLCCLAAPPIILFVAIAFWSPRVLFHWAAPGYLFLFPLLGRELAALQATGSRLPRRLLAPSAALIALACLGAGAQGLVNWLPRIAGAEAAQAMEWTSLGPELAARGLDRPGLMLAGIRWHECGKLDIALGREHPLLCLTPDPRQYGIVQNLAAARGHDVLILAPRTDLPGIEAELGPRFARITQLAALTLHLGAGVDIPIPAYLGSDLR